LCYSSPANNRLGEFEHDLERDHAVVHVTSGLNTARGLASYRIVSIRVCVRVGSAHAVQEWGIGLIGACRFLPLIQRLACLQLSSVRASHLATLSLSHFQNNFMALFSTASE